MDSAAVALLAAGIPATVAALTFAATQILAAVQASRNRRSEAMFKVIDALEQVADNQRLPWIIGRFRLPELRVSMDALRLYLVLSKRDRILWRWLGVRAQDLADASGLARVTIAADMTALVVAFLPARHRAARRYLYRRLLREGRADVATGIDYGG